VTEQQPAIVGPSTRQRQIEFIEILGAMPDLWARLLAEHVPDPSGSRCRACTIAGTGSPGAAWPCRIRDVAEAARARYTANTRTA
jgi:hypothetical protein